MKASKLNIALAVWTRESMNDIRTYIHMFCHTVSPITVFPCPHAQQQVSMTSPQTHGDAWPHFNTQNNSKQATLNDVGAIWPKLEWEPLFANTEKSAFINTSHWRHWSSNLIFFFFFFFSDDGVSYKSEENAQHSDENWIRVCAHTCVWIHVYACTCVVCGGSVSS